MECLYKISIGTLAFKRFVYGASTNNIAKSILLSRLVDVNPFLSVEYGAYKKGEYVMQNTQSAPIMLFDGDCALCNGTVQFVLDNDQQGQLCFASLQSSHGQQYLRKFGLPTVDFKSYMVVEGECYYLRYAAVQRMLYHMGGRWRLLEALSKIIPGFIGDFFYSLGFNNRYKILGKNTQCRLLEPALKHRFLDVSNSGFS